MKDLEAVKNNNQVFIRKIRSDSFDYYMEYRDTVIYILFEDEYSFDCIPKEFTLIQHVDYTDKVISALEHKIELFDENNHKKMRLEIELELDKYCEILKKWADNLPDNN